MSFIAWSTHCAWNGADNSYGDDQPSIERRSGSGSAAAKRAKPGMVSQSAMAI